MTFTAGLIGGLLGTSAHMMSNALRKVPTSRQPWLHVGFFIIGAWGGNKYQSIEREVLQEVNEIRAEKGMPPMIATNEMLPLSLRYKKPE
mmetsp:Transcript_10696/g.13220  ORF Transcript_10696/g.13220 Transcript_10696/m.13220 type:complete len:90 (-) Transcript_10696:338-607(-)|eukprot:CAMPEP_0172483438 /NCGR_PEP_ID=MMETSP1066-20121228/10470_1 /TAXON_ID=671091 /ORGANISM="Coscinodiscus wailesii, Strain CCMP2513" /LENGTH=89 /DNA_ID=CAMNT_0013247333 /DNA_START=111 /DNA_END=380 /DNA_ORIENTATION=-